MLLTITTIIASELKIIERAELKTQTSDMNEQFSNRKLWANIGSIGCCSRVKVAATRLLWIRGRLLRQGCLKKIWLTFKSNSSYAISKQFLLHMTITYYHFPWNAHILFQCQPFSSITKPILASFQIIDIISHKNIRKSRCCSCQRQIKENPV